jgi:hypothetical protein
MYPPTHLPPPLPACAPRCPSAELLFVGFTNGDIRGYSLTELRLMVQIKKHTDIVLSLVYIPKHDVLVSSSVDPHVYAWDCSGTDYRLKVRPWVCLACLACLSWSLAYVSLADCPLPLSLCQASLQGSDTGIRKMVYGSRSDVIVGAGFQFSGLVWDASSNRLLMKLVGHRATIIDVAILKTTYVYPSAAFLTHSSCHVHAVPLVVYRPRNRVGLCSGGGGDVRVSVPCQDQTRAHRHHRLQLCHQNLGRHGFLDGHGFLHHDAGAACAVHGAPFAGGAVSCGVAHVCACRVALRRPVVAFFTGCLPPPAFLCWGHQVMDNFDIVLAGMKMSRFSLEMQVRYELPVCTLYNSVFRSIITISGRSIRMWSAVDGSITKEFKLIASSVGCPVDVGCCAVP